MKRERKNYWKSGMKIGALVGFILFLVYYGFLVFLGIGLESSLGDGKITFGNFFPNTWAGLFEVVSVLFSFILYPALIGGIIGFFLKRK